MSGADGKGPFDGGRRKDGSSYRDGNTSDDGSYIVGRNKPPKAGQFRKGDGRRRGRRPKGTENHDTFFERERGRKIIVREDGQERRVTKGQGVDLRLISNASRGDIRAIGMVDDRRRRIAEEKEETARRYHKLSDAEILHQYLEELSAERQVDPDLFRDDHPHTDDGEHSYD